MISRIVFIAMFLIVFCIGTGCRPSGLSTNEPNNPQYFVDEAAEANVRFEITNLRAENRLSTNWQEERANAKKVLNQLLLEINKLPSVPEQDSRYQILVQQLIYEYRFAEAANVATKIQDRTAKDLLLEDIVRFLIKDIWQTYQKIAGLANNSELSKDILEQIELAIKTTKQIDDPLRQAESFANIALFRMKMKDRNGTVKMMNDAAESCRNKKEIGLRKAQGLCSFAHWFLREENKEKTLKFCTESESALLHTEQSFDSARLYLDISAIYILLGLEEPARRTCEKAEKIVSTISEPYEKATLLLKLAESLLVIRMKDQNIPLADRLLSIKKRILEAAEILAQLPAEKTETKNKTETEIELGTEIGTEMKMDKFFISTELPESSVLLSGNETFSENKTKLHSLSRRELVQLKNEMLRKIASMQAWGVSLEDVWETIEEIDPGNERDDALVTVIDMMMITRSTEDIEAWAEEIIDPIKKNSVLEKLNRRD
ncbi:MAG: hypothetical protein LBQ50_02970 [Planctomycetaceae bacterium]|nr:hypothetical protein [Planctomycetaceae bacterium]